MLNGVKLKKILFANPALIITLLESLGCHNIIMQRDSITCSNPDGDNRGAISILLNETLNCKNYTRAKFETDYKIKDIIALTQFLMGAASIDEAIQYIKSICTIDARNCVSNDTVLYPLKKMIKKLTPVTVCNDDILGEHSLEDYLDVYILDFLNDGISYEIQDEFNICYDLVTNRALIPIRNAEGHLATYKGRTLDKEYKEKGIQKYSYIHDSRTHTFSGRFYLFGEYENREYIANSDTIYVFEAEKSVMQAAAFGVRNCVAIANHIFSKEQIKKLLSYRKKIVICFDKDVDALKVMAQCRAFKNKGGLYFVIDTEGLLDEKSSPTDKGKAIFDALCARCIPYAEGG